MRKVAGEGEGGGFRGLSCMRPYVPMAQGPRIGRHGMRCVKDEKSRAWLPSEFRVAQATKQKPL